MKKTLLILTSLVAALLGAQAQEKMDPKAAPEAQVICGNARFTVLTSRLIRMEWAQDGVFEDRASLAVINRNLPVPKFKVSRGRNSVTIRTADVVLRYKGPQEFNSGNLSVTFDMGKWVPGADESGNLMGTLRTLDGSRGFARPTSKGDPYEPGILSRDGWAIVDESSRYLLEADGSSWGEWVTPRPEGERKDLYIFAYGHDYKAALKDFTAIAGRIPLPPKYVFGYWWSRFWQYSDFEFVNLGKEIRSHSIPIDVMVIDMDWHRTYSLIRHNAPRDEFGERIGWTGYTWKEQLFPDPASTLEQLHRNNLKTSLNLHPASGIQPYEDCYDAFVADYCSRTGETPEEGRKPVPFHMDRQEWADAYLNSVIHPLEDQGVDFWWLDWQQWKESKYNPGLSNTFWLNYTFFNDKIRRSRSEGLSATRPLIYHRWGGLGSHRYQIGFSGDCYDTWDVLKFLPYFTATSSNVGYGYWGHDIGGHQNEGDPYKPEIYTRWLQYGVFTPIFKTHSTKNGAIERRMWVYPEQYSRPMMEAVRLRYSLSPYIYAAARQAYDSGICICRPMYYDYPENPEAYDLKEQFMFGDNILATTIGQSVDPATGLAGRSIWFPEGSDWYDVSSGRIYKGGQIQTLRYTIDENPWYVRAGAIIPMADENISSLQEASNVLRLFVAPGDGSSSVIHYEDDGISQAYSRDYATTRIEKSSSAQECRVHIGAREGSYEGMDPLRKPSIILEGVPCPASVKVNGVDAAYARFPEDQKGKASWNYVGKDLAIVVSLPEGPATEEITVEVKYPATDVELLRGKKGVMHRMMAMTPVFKEVFGNTVDPWRMLPDSFLNLAQCASYIDADPAGFEARLRSLDADALYREFTAEAEKISDPANKEAFLKSRDLILSQIND